MGDLFFGCGAEEHDFAIHIQAHGVLLVLHEADLSVVQVSANTEQLLGVASDQLLGQPLTLLFGSAQVAHMLPMLQASPPEMRSLMQLQLQSSDSPRPLLAQLQRQNGFVLLELEPAPSLLMPWSELVATLRALRMLRSLAGIWPVVAAQVRQLTAFERVTVVQFQADGSGLVLAEQLHADLAALPPQAATQRLPPVPRSYYLKPHICVLVDLKISPTGLISAPHGPHEPPLTYEQLSLLAPSAAQWSMLQRDGVRAVLNIPLFHHGSLWGMICCLDYTQPHPTTFILHTIAELLSEFLSLRLSTLALQPEALTARLTERQGVLRLGWLQTITAALGEALNLQAVARVIVDLATAALEAQQGYLLLRSADGLSLTLAHTNENDAKLTGQMNAWPLDARLPITEAVRNGTPLFLTRVPADDPRFSDAMQLVMVINIPTGAMAALPLGDGARGGIVFAFQQSHSFSPAEQEFLLTVAELTLRALERVRLYEDLQAARAQAEAAVRMRDQFLSVATHELKSPMAALVGHAQLIERRLRKAEHGDQALRLALQQITHQAQRLDRMLNELFDISRIEQGQLTIHAIPLDLSGLLVTLVNMIQPDLPRHTLHTSGLEVAHLVLGDEVRLIQVFENLISNAVKYSPFGGNVWIKLEASSSYVRVSVRDNGIGIPAAELPNLFQCFYRASNSGRWRIHGTGIGLYVVAEILRRHEGTVRVQSSEGAGSDFVVELPLVVLEQKARES